MDHPGAPAHAADQPAEAARDPVCGMTVDPHTARTAPSTTAGPTISAPPAAAPSSPPTPQYTSPATPLPPNPPPIYTCPMHPEIRQVGPGLLPDLRHGARAGVATADAGPNPELVDMTRRFWIGPRARPAGASCWKWAGISPAHRWVVGRSCRTGCSSCSPTPVVLWAGWPFFVRGWHSLVTRNLNMFTLIAMGTGVAWLYSVGRDAGAGVSSRRLPRPWRRGRGLFRGRRRHHRAGAARPGAGAARARERPRARSARCSTSRRRPRAASAPTAATRRTRSLDASPSATACACGPARRCRSTARWSRGRSPSTSRW